MSLSAAQCRAGRALLGWSQDELVAASKVSKSTIANFELGNRTPYGRTLGDIEKTLEAAGVVFLAPGETTDGGAGVRLAKDGPTMLDVAVVDRDGPKPDMPKAK